MRSPISTSSTASSRPARTTIVGISRTSKTPLSTYLAQRGLKVANVPLVLGIDPPEELAQVDDRRRRLRVLLELAPQDLQDATRLLRLPEITGEVRRLQHVRPTALVRRLHCARMPRRQHRHECHATRERVGEGRDAAQKPPQLHHVPPT